ncbi:hypothetical protein IWX48DRAFT_18621 [Phyllosticta citricarpa]
MTMQICPRPRSYHRCRHPGVSVATFEVISLPLVRPVRRMRMRWDGPREWSCHRDATRACQSLRLNCFLPFAWASEAEEPALVWLAEEAQRRDEVKRATRTTTAGLSLLERSNTRTNSRVPLPVLLQRLSFTKPACYASPPLHPRHSPSLVLHHAPHTASPIPVASQTVDSFTTFKVAAAHVSLVPDWPARANVRRGSCPPARLLLGRQGTERR